MGAGDGGGGSCSLDSSNNLGGAVNLIAIEDNENAYKIGILG